MATIHTERFDHSYGVEETFTAWESSPINEYIEALTLRDLGEVDLIGSEYYVDLIGFEYYSDEDALCDAVANLPTPAQVKTLVESLRIKELREVTEGVFNDCSMAARTLRPLESASAINSWVATAEEIITTRRTYRHISAARNKGNPTLNDSQ